MKFATADIASYMHSKYNCDHVKVEMTAKLREMRQIRYLCMTGKTAEKNSYDRREV